MTDKRIVKVQLSLATTHNDRQCLIYDEREQWMYEGSVTKDLQRVMGDFPKLYFYAHLDGDGVIQLDDRAPEQEW